MTEERFQVEWVTELSRGIEWLRDGGVRVAVLDLNLGSLPTSPAAEATAALAEAHLASVC